MVCCGARVFLRLGISVRIALTVRVWVSVSGGRAGHASISIHKFGKWKVKTYGRNTELLYYSSLTRKNEKMDVKSVEGRRW